MNRGRRTDIDAPRFVCASANPGKVAEIVALLDGRIDLVPRPAGMADVVEDADTLLGNARLKAVAVCAATGLAAISDDTGLEVDALGGRPGVFTARFAGAHCSDADNRAKMLALLAGVAPAARTARFKTVAMAVWPTGEEVAVEGVCAGHIAEEERGQRGFGYDRLFVPEGGGGRTFAEMAQGAKNELSHRGKAFRMLLAALQQRGSAALPRSPRS
ncbi:MAG: RdgB/HAM1 family non-canonical purine NTP pyrophosphatase [Ilumatobacteraceae bacterium]